MQFVVQASKLLILSQSSNIGMELKIVNKWLFALLAQGVGDIICTFRTQSTLI